jgi:preprotein translocase subunit SecE
MESTVVREMQRENRLVQYFRETRAELRKVVWPTREEAVNLTVIVVATIFAMSVFLGFFDYLFTVLFRFLIAPR